MVPSHFAEDHLIEKHSAENPLGDTQSQTWCFNGPFDLEEVSPNGCVSITYKIRFTFSG